MATGSATEEFIKQAKRELAEERFRQKVEEVKARLRRPWWVKLFPWKIIIVRRDYD